MNSVKFYDTSSLLLKAETLFDTEEEFAISSITLEELENIKSSANKDSDVKHAARLLAVLLDENIGKYHVEFYTEDTKRFLFDVNAYINNDLKIYACALSYRSTLDQDTELVFVTNDICLKHLARQSFKVESVTEDEDEYVGYKDITMSEVEMAHFYMNPYTNLYDLYINEYLIIRNENNEIVDKLCWTGEEYRPLTYSTFSSSTFGDIKPLKGDIQQALFADSLTQNKITMVKGPAGSGKTILSLAYLFYLLERHKIDKIIIFCNTVATKDAAKLGFLPGSRDQKLLDSQIGILLASKLGDSLEVERLIDEGKLLLLPMSDIRGFDTSGMNAGIYISEAQNLSVSLMKLALQRIGEDSICIIDGDCRTQVDDIAFAGSNNGMRRASKVFRGHDFYGEVTLAIIHRSRIGQVAEAM